MKFLRAGKTKIFSKEDQRQQKVNTSVRSRNIFWVLISPSLEAPRGVFKLHFVPCRPSGIDGLLSDEAMTSSLCVLVDPVHLALIDTVLLVVMVRNSTVIGSAVRRSKVVV